MNLRTLCSLSIAFTLTTYTHADNWPQFRGPGGDSQASVISLPQQWSASENLAWKVAVPGEGWSQPVVWGDKVFLATADSDKPRKPKGFMAGVTDPATRMGAKEPPKTVFRYEVHCLDLNTGKTLWKSRVAQGQPKLPVHPSNTYATETLATDGERVYTYFGVIGKVAAFDLDGKPVWEVDLGAYPTGNGFGPGASPIAQDGKVFVQCDNEKNSFLVALDAKTGKEVWRAKRPTGTSWSTPYLWTNRTRTELIACGRGKVISYDPASGKVNWTFAGIPSSFASSPIGNKDLLFFGNSGPGSDGPLLAIKAGGSGDITPPEGQTAGDYVLWSRKGSGPGFASPVVAGDYLYIVNNAFLNCYRVDTGEKVYRERLPKTRNVVANPFVAGDQLYILGESGQTHIVKLGEEFELLSTNEIDDLFWSSPAVTGDRLLLRGVEGVYCIQK